MITDMITYFAYKTAIYSNVVLTLEVSVNDSKYFSSKSMHTLQLKCVNSINFAMEEGIYTCTLNAWCNLWHQTGRPTDILQGDLKSVETMIFSK